MASGLFISVDAKTGFGVKSEIYSAESDHFDLR